MAELHTKKSAGSISYVSRPQISKYDYQYNGRLCLKINDQKSFRDCKAYQLEDRLDDMMLELYAAAEGLKQQRLAREEAERKRQEDARREEERQNIPDIGGKRRPDSCK